MTVYQDVVEGIYTHGFHIADQFLPPDTVDELRKTALQLVDAHQFTGAKIGSREHASTNQDIRRDAIYWLDDPSDDPAVNEWFKAMGMISRQLNQHLFLGLVQFETHFACYPPGSFYKKHVDQFHNKQNRRISCVYYLNVEWEASFGGELNIYDQSDNLMTSILPLSNRLVCFCSTLPHEVSTTTRTRLSITGWMKTR